MPAKTKICFVLHAPIGGGAERISLRLAQNLDRAKFEITFLFFNIDGDYADIIPKDITVKSLEMPIPESGRLTSPVWIYRLGNALRAIGPDVIFSNLGYTNLMVMLSRAFFPVKAKYVIREAIMLSGYLKLDKQESFKRAVYKFCYKKADAIIAQSQAMKKDLAAYLGVDAGRVTVINNFIDKSLVDRQRAETPDLPGLGLATDKPVIISAGRLEPVKNVDVALRVFAELLKTCGASLWILGQGSEEGRLRRLAGELGVTEHVKFLGFQKNPYQFYRHADVFLSASQLEGFPNVLLEAIYCGALPAFTAFNEGIHEFFKDGENILIIDKDRPAEAAEKIRRALGDRDAYEKILGNAVKTLAHFDVRKILAEYEKIFLEKD